MGARQKLNAAYFQASVVVAAVAGLLTDSWPVFIVSVAVLVGANLCAGDIRPNRNKSFQGPGKPGPHPRRHR
jgi:hypothetical protein